VEDVLASVNQRTQDLHEELSIKSEETHLGLQAVTTTFNTQAESLCEEIEDAKKDLHEEIADTTDDLHEELDLRFRTARVQNRTGPHSCHVLVTKHGVWTANWIY
jgi:phage host-nuclease inhibitor protein Gam